MSIKMIARVSKVVLKKKGRITAPLHEVDGVWRVAVVCERGHGWTPRATNLIHDKSWCPHCHGNARHSLKMLHAHAKKMGGACLATAYANATSNYRWQCGACSHVWKATWNNVNAYCSWCPACRNSIRENITREVFREHFPGHAFLTDRAAIRMELDGYSAELKLAFEHDGLQHRQRVVYFQRSDADFEAQQARDRRKDVKCAKAGITLVRVPDRLVLPSSDMRAHIHRVLAGLGHPTPAPLSSDADFLDRVQMNRQSRQKGYVVQARKILTKRGDVMITAQCPTKTFPIMARCAQGHEYRTSLDKLSRGRGCPRCVPARRGNRRRLTPKMAAAELEAMRLVSDEPYRNSNSPAVYTCDDGHRFASSLSKIRQIKSTVKCPSCIITAMPDLDCKDEYTPETDGNHTKLRWICKARGHTFDAAYATIRRLRGRNPVVCKECRVGGVDT